MIADDDLECSAYGRYHGIKLLLGWAAILTLVALIDWCIIKVILWVI